MAKVEFPAHARILLGFLVEEETIETLEAFMTVKAAEAWEQGRRTGHSRAMRHMSDEPSISLSNPEDNPYKD